MDTERTIQGGRFIGPLERKLQPDKMAKVDPFWESWNRAQVPFREELACVDEEHIKRAFAIAWLARGEADRNINHKANPRTWQKKLDNCPAIAQSVEEAR